MSELKKCGICGAVSIRKDGHIFHKTDDCIRNLEAQILELHSKIARLVEAGDAMIKWKTLLDGTQICPFCYYEKNVCEEHAHGITCPVTEWQKAKLEGENETILF